MIVFVTMTGTVLVTRKEMQEAGISGRKRISKLRMLMLEEFIGFAALDEWQGGGSGCLDGAGVELNYDRFALPGPPRLPVWVQNYDRFTVGGPTETPTDWTYKEVR